MSETSRSGRWAPGRRGHRGGLIPVGCYALLSVIMAFPLPGAAREAETARVLASLFPQASIEQAALSDGAAPSTLIDGVTRKGKRGFILVEEVSSVFLSRSLAVMAFPIHWHDSARPAEFATAHAPGLPKPMLTQVIFFDPSNRGFLAKPPGFPLETTGWGDAVTIIGLEEIGNDSGAVVFRYGYGTGPDRLQVLAFADGRAGASAVLMEGDLGGESGAQASARYSGWTREGDTISAQADTYCDPGDPGFCSALGLAAGKSSRRVEVLRLSDM